MSKGISPETTISPLRRPLVVALNPSVDVEWMVQAIRRDEKNPIRFERRWAGGKGVNVARWLDRFLQDPRLLLPVGGGPGREMANFLRQEGLHPLRVRIQEPTRTNIIVTPASGLQLRFNPAGPKISAPEWAAIFRLANRALVHASCLVLSGSLPRTAPVRTYARFISCAARHRIPVLLDCDGPAFAAAVRKRPFLVKPNRAELSEWAGRDLRSVESCLLASQQLSEETKGWVLASLGSKGALLVHARAQRAWHGQPPLIKAQNTVGAGDALLAAVASQILQKKSPEAWLRWGIAAGTACTQGAPGFVPGLPRIRQFATRVVVRDLGD